MGTDAGQFYLPRLARIKIPFDKSIFLQLVGPWNGKLVEKSTNERVEIRWVDGVEMWIDGKLDSDTMVFGRFERTSAHITGIVVSEE